MSRVHVTIDELVLKGLEPVARKALVEGLQKELAQLLSDPAARKEWAHAHRTPVLRLGQMPLEAGASGGRIFGKQMARAVGRGLKPGGAKP
jgi:hypothetical protein